MQHAICKGIKYKEWSKSNFLYCNIPSLLMHDIYQGSTSLLKKNKISRCFLPFTLISAFQHYSRDDYWYQRNKTPKIIIPQ